MTKEREIYILNILVGMLRTPKIKKFGGICAALLYLQAANFLSYGEEVVTLDHLRELRKAQGRKIYRYWFRPYRMEPRIKLIEERLKILQS